MLSSRKEIDAAIWANYRRFLCAPYLFGADNNQDSPGLFDTADLKILTTFFSPGHIRASSNTFSCLYTMLKEPFEDRLFMDYCFFPFAKDLQVFRETEIPLWSGNVSHAPVRDYDLVFVSHAILQEALNIPYAMANSDVPLDYDERMKDKTLPILFYGGASTHNCTVVYSPDGGKSLVDLAMAGSAEGVLPHVIEEIYGLKSKGYDLKADKEKVIEWLRQKSSQKSYLMNPKVYRWEYAPDHRLVSISCTDPLATQRPEVARKRSTDFPGFKRKVLHLDGEGVEAHDLQISLGCSANLCSFCSEGQASGGWSQKSLPDLVKDMKESVLWSAANTVSYFSYNSNFYAPFLDLLKESADLYSNVSLITMRADVLAESPEYLELSKVLGVLRQTMAVEGMGERLRNKLLNKNLSRQQIMDAARNVFRQRLMTLKLNMIITGQETDEDIQEFLSEIDELARIRSECGALTKIVLSFTPLIIYPNTPLRFLPRVSAYNVFYERRTMNDLVAMVKSRGDAFKVKFNVRGPGNYLEQNILDLGPLGCELIKDLSVNRGVLYHRHFTNGDYRDFKRALDDHGIDKEFCFRARGVEELQPIDVFTFTTPKQFSIWKEQYKKMDFSRSYCLKTPAHLEARCSDCGLCETVQQKKDTYKRDISSQSTVEDVVASLSGNRHMATTRVQVNVDPRWDFASGSSLSFFITSQFMKVSPKLRDSFYEVGYNTRTWTSRDNQPGWFGGTFVFDIFWNSRISAKDLLSVMEEVNKRLTVCKVVGVVDSDKDFKIKTNGFVSYIGQIDGGSMSELSDRLMNFDWMVDVSVKLKGNALSTEKQHHPEFRDKLFFSPYKERIWASFFLPIEYNPYLVSSSIFKRKPLKMVEDSRFHITGHFFPTEATCSCGEPLFMDLGTNQTESLCPICRGKRMLYRLTKFRDWSSR